MENTIIKKIAQKGWKKITLEEKKKYIDILFEGGYKSTIELIYNTCDSSNEREKYGKDDKEIREYIELKAKQNANTDIHNSK